MKKNFNNLWARCSVRRVPLWASGWSCLEISWGFIRRSPLQGHWPLRNWPSALARQSATCANGLHHKQPAGYIDFDPATERFSMSPEQALLLANEDGPAFFPAMFEVAAAAARDLPKLETAFRTGGGVGWH